MTLRLPLILFFSILVMTSGCSPYFGFGQTFNPHTGEEQELLHLPKWSFWRPELMIGNTVYVQSTRLRARSTPELTETNIANILYQNDQLQILQNHIEGSDFAKIVVINSISDSTIGQQFFVPQDYLALAPVALDTEALAAKKIFIVQNIATKTSRIYQRCETTPGCAHTLIATMDNVVGDNTPEKRTLLGTFKITNWFKFYQDHDGKYPSWYIPNFPIPAPLSDLAQWFSPAFMPNGRGEIRGGFGWYTAYVGPEASAQWMHGTFGWGADKKTALQNTASHGCTRFDNESVAYLRNLAPTGATVVRVYAAEKIKGDAQNPDKQQWSYILTKLSVNSEEHDKSGREEVVQKGIPPSQWLEEGLYEVEKTTTALNGNAYNIQSGDFIGQYNVDTGRFESYQHPRQLEKGGYEDLVLPDYLIQR